MSTHPKRVDAIRAVLLYQAHSGDDDPILICWDDEACRVVEGNCDQCYVVGAEDRRSAEQIEADMEAQRRGH